MTAPLVSVVVPTRNAGLQVLALLDALTTQDVDFGVEIVAVDSGSTDGTAARLRGRGVTVIEVAPSDFDHGRTRNVGLAAARGTFGVLLVQDAVPATRRWLAELVRPLREDPAVAGSFARQQPADGASRLTSYYLSRWIAAGREPWVMGPVARDRFNELSPQDRHRVCAFDNVCSCIRLEAWRTHPFHSTRIAEDLEWALDVLLAGHKIAFAPAAVVRHSHDRSAAYELQRTYLVHQRLQALFGLATVPTVPALLRAMAVTLPVHLRIASREDRARVRAVVRAMSLAVAMPLGQYLGARSAREGRELLRVRGV